MQWRGRRGSQNIEDRRSRSGGRAGGIAVGGGSVGLLAIVVIGYFLGVDLTPLLNDQSMQNTGGGEITAADEEAAQFVSVTLADTEDVWATVFREQLGETYTPAALVLYKGVTQSPCGGASGATGPFYCPGDRKVYLDTDFFVAMERQLGAGGDFAAAYVVAHEIGHHVQDELGILSQANAARGSSSEADANAISVRIELQADCFAGIWARHAEAQFGSIEAGDMNEAVNAARQIGDDTLQRNAGRVPSPHTFTHGTSEQRSRWFQTGHDSGQLESCDTFAAERL
ncbi:KPN_02809 family neutral zinc metallopeptidase [Falsirhodobacter sp. 20TX0035]|uniref:KPN_02809 family neutral zinc metallopeptidase n=1 Tax=Falsirhodobacter sp. 20TX0035 TaxID=3022019 RepID=UPI00232E84BC|nr:neutral zinc metallopeptidase [Falsirhodobacter sp. 20TX0035]MDB6452897.1 neutral zinc metallopeptidase [Falsirhodobacter sp. 20TX0035]